MKSEKLKRNFWHSSEIECMLNLIKEVKSQGSTATAPYTFIQIANKMKKRGFPNKSPTQIRRKWFQMKSAYLCYRKGNVERLMLIPERFRSVIAQFVENDNKTPRVPVMASPTANKMKKIKIESGITQQTFVEKFVTRMKYNNASMNNDFKIMQESLMQYEHKCQVLRDYNFTKYLALNW